MAEDFKATSGKKDEQYQHVLRAIGSVVSGETDLTANLANVAAILKYQFNWWWVGFYLVKGSDLVLGPFQGPLACTRIPKGKGVCGTAWDREMTSYLMVLLTTDKCLKFPGFDSQYWLSRCQFAVSDSQSTAEDHPDRSFSLQLGPVGCSAEPVPQQDLFHTS